MGIFPPPQNTACVCLSMCSPRPHREKERMREFTMRSYEHFLVSYLPSLQDVQNVLDIKSKQISSYAYIMHDKDYYPEDVIDKDTGDVLHIKGELKPPHIHIYLRLINNRDVSEIRRWFESKDENGQKINCLSRIVRDRVSCINYLIHNTKASKNKYQYSVGDVVSYNIEHIDDDMPIDNTYYVVEDMLKGLPRMELLKKYGRDFLYHYSSYVQFVKDLGSEEFNKMTQDMKTVFGEPLPFGIK